MGREKEGDEVEIEMQTEGGERGRRMRRGLE